MVFVLLAVQLICWVGLALAGVQAKRQAEDRQDTIEMYRERWNDVTKMVDRLEKENAELKGLKR